MKLFKTILMGAIAALLVTASVFLTIDGNLAKLTGWYRVTPGMPLFTSEHAAQFDQVCWMRLRTLTDTVECIKDDKGVWWIISPFRDKLNPEIASRLLTFATHATIVDTLDVSDNEGELAQNLRDFGFESDFWDITLKIPQNDSADELTTAARFTLGKKAPWVSITDDGKHSVDTTYLKTNFYGADDRVHVVNSGDMTSLFSRGVVGLRDPQPLRFDPNELTNIRISLADGNKYLLNRKNADAPWYLTTPHQTTIADQENVAKLVLMLCSLNARDIREAADVTLPEKPQCEIELRTGAKAAPLNLKLYEQFTQDALRGSYSATDGAHCYATVNDRKVVFTLPAVRKSREGQFASLINAVYSLPVLPAEEMASIRGLDQVYTAQLPLSLNQLRSHLLPMFDERDVQQILIMSPFLSKSLRLCLIPGIKESNTQDSWTIEEVASNQVFEAEVDDVRRFLRNFRTIPVEEIVADIPSEPQAAAQLKKKYHLNTPDYTLFIEPKTCGYRSHIFGVDLPLVKDRNPKIYYISIIQNETTGELQHYAMEQSGNMICRLAPAFTKRLATRLDAWKSRSLVGFHISSLKNYTVEFLSANEIFSLDYDHTQAGWSGTINGKDATVLINPHHAVGCIDSIRKLKVREWLPPYDESAIACLRKPELRVKIQLQIEKESDAEAIVADAEELGHHLLDESGQYRNTSAAEVLQDDSDFDQKFRDQVFAEVQYENKTITIEIAPMTLTEDTPMFYGRILETGQIFTLNNQDAVSLGKHPFEIQQ
ncbi:MAG: hypothetical protein E7033_01245 [Akkermansiaceae bacterium]|nr:hypothetical protein [Akkermansiaceae bacterium]